MIVVKSTPLVGCTMLIMEGHDSQKHCQDSVITRLETDWFSVMNNDGEFCVASMYPQILG